jgi:catechol 2,3-dioxygenase-like lactoylglutathione lyase family enzyme
MREFTRRQLLISLSALGTLAVSRFRAGVWGQTVSPPIRVRSLNHFGIAVSDPKRTIDFYQGLFGMSIQARRATTTILRVGAGPQFLSIRPVEFGASPSITHYGLGVEGFNIDRIITMLAAHGIVKADAVGPLKANVTMRDGGTDLVFGDPDGIVCQLQDVSYCGGSGLFGDRCSATEAPPTKGLIALRDINHVTIFSPDSQRSNAFYRSLFGFSIRSYQSPTAPTLAVGPTVQFLVIGGGAAGVRRDAQAAPRPASITHGCWSLDAFKLDDIIEKLERYGLKPREGGQAPVGPLRHYVTMRMENRGGAPGGTPELYFTDPDGLVMQLQDTSYCGGSGFLGNECPKT